MDCTVTARITLGKKMAGYASSALKIVGVPGSTSVDKHLVYSKELVILQ